MKDKNVYIIYAKIPPKLWRSKISLILQTVEDYYFDDYVYNVIYAWTTSLKLLNDFKQFRKGAMKNIYIIEKELMDDDEYLQFKSEHKYTKLKYRDVPTNDNEYHGTNEYANVLCTKAEFLSATEEGREYLYNYLSGIIKVEYRIFSEKYVNILDQCAYCDEFNYLYSDDDDYWYSDRYMLTEYNSSFNLTMFGNQKKIDLYSNKFWIFINLFYEMINGYEDGEFINFC